MISDLRYAIRGLLRAPAFSVVAITTLALGIGANTAIFTVVDAVLLRPLPFVRPEQLVRIFGSGPQLDKVPISPANFLDWKQQNHVFEKISAYSDDTLTLLGGEMPERIRAERVSAEFFEVLGVSPALGRPFAKEEDEYGRNQVVVLSHEFWQSHFGGRTNIVGQVVVLNDKAFTIVGVMPAGFSFPDRRIQLWTPMGFTPAEKALRDTNYLDILGRLKSGVGLQRAGAQMNVLVKQIAQQHPELNAGESVKLIALADVILGDVRPLLVILVTAVALVLLICCANVANLLLARGAARHKEIAIRSAVGASRGQVVRLLLVESTALGLIGGAFGCVVANLGIDLLLSLQPVNLPRLDEVAINWRVLGFTAGVSVLSGILFGLAPALQASKSQLHDALKRGDRAGTDTPARSRMRSVLVGLEVALSLVLLVAAALLIRSFGRLLDVDPGFRPEKVLTISVPLSASRYKTPQEQAAFFQRLLRQLSQVSGIEAVGAVSDLPLFGGSSTGFDISGRPLSAPTERPLTDYRAASPEYFRAMGIELVAGRTFTDADKADGSPVAIINQTLAHRYFGNENPIGKRIGLSRPIDWREIVGVVRDVRNYGLTADVKPECYVPYLQNSPDYLAGSAAWMVVMVQTNGAPVGYGNAVKREIQLIDKDQPISSIKPMSAYLAQSIAQRRFNMILLGVFATVALAVAAVGIYGVISYSVAQRTRELGIRMALGAGRADILTLMSREGMRPALLGLGIGLAAAAATTRFMASLVFEVSVTDPLIFASVALILAGVALMACLLPAHRASRINPIDALRYE